MYINMRMYIYVYMYIYLYIYPNFNAGARSELRHVESRLASADERVVALQREVNPGKYKITTQMLNTIRVAAALGAFPHALTNTIYIYIYVYIYIYIYIYMYIHIYGVDTMSDTHSLVAELQRAVNPGKPKTLCKCCIQ